MKKIKIYSTESVDPNPNGKYKVIRFNKLLSKWEDVLGEVYDSEEEAKKRMRELNDESKDYFEV